MYRGYVVQDGVTGHPSRPRTKIHRPPREPNDAEKSQAVNVDLEFSLRVSGRIGTDWASFSKQSIGKFSQSESRHGLAELRCQRSTVPIADLIRRHDDHSRCKSSMSLSGPAASSGDPTDTERLDAKRDRLMSIQRPTKSQSHRYASHHLGVTVYAHVAVWLCVPCCSLDGDHDSPS